ncbi:cupin domain-containing protein [Xenorhabdus sp. PB30.3]|uniref:cupin domain-containing protein n=1 Tax=Xenorhabdus sp. PB30.3 TaxID=2788941 RepID=UPI001E5458F8|nr:cupin domain-containing protein [Xenorhabdus sp. PB30.3]MCC8381724.1 cupin domain-containing protein [Xenorhabdus sp. PB30.3]
MNPIAALRKVTNLKQEFDLIKEVWSPKVITETNEYKIIILLADGDFIWHTHEKEDKVFMVIEGELRIDFKDEHVIIKQGEFFVVPKGEESKPSSTVLTKLLLIEPIVAN